MRNTLRTKTLRSNRLGTNTLRTNGLRLGALAIAATAATGLLAGPASASTHRPEHHTSGHAVFVQTDEITGNHIAAYAQNENGTLTLAHTYATGGQGGVLANSVIDHLASQGGVTYDGAHHLLYAVNAGSNTVSIFGVKGDKLTLHQVVGSGGSFPVSVAVHGDTVYVLNGHDGGTIQGYAVFAGFLLRVPSWHRALGLDPTQLDFTQSPGQVSFTPDGQQLIVTTKANGNNLEIFRLDHFGGPSAKPTVTNQAGAVPFAAAFDARGHLAVADAGTTSIATYTVNHDGSVTQLASVPTGQQGTCWVVSDGNLLFATNPGSASVTALRSGPRGQLTVLGSTPTDAGTVDPVVSADGRFLYVETGAAGIVDEYRVRSDGTLTRIGSVTVANAAGAEGIATS